MIAKVTMVVTITIVSLRALSRRLGAQHQGDCRPKFADTILQESVDDRAPGLWPDSPAAVGVAQALTESCNCNLRGTKIRLKSQSRVGVPAPRILRR